MAAASMQSEAPRKITWLLAAYIFIVLGRIPEIIAAHVGGLHITMILLILLSVACLFGDFRRAASSRPGIFMILCTIWILAAIPFSTWKGGSFKVLTDYWAASFLIFFASASLIVTIKDFWRVSMGIFLGMAFLVTLGPLLFGSGSDAGRFEFSVGTLSNANLLGQHLLYGLPFCILIVKQRGLFTIKGVCAAVVTGLVLTTVLKTGSRASFAALIVMAIAGFLEVSLKGKIKMILFYTVLAVGMVAFTPQGAMKRYVLMFSSEPVNANDEELVTAEASSEARKRHLMQSLILTATHPIFGVGPGTFLIAAADYASSLGERADWLETHNTVTQLSSETGIPGVTFYLLMVFFATTPLFSIRKKIASRPELKDLANMASAIRLSILGTISAGLFASLAYEYYFPMMAGLSVSFCYIAEKKIQEYDSRQQTANSPVPSNRELYATPRDRNRFLKSPAQASGQLRSEGQKSRIDIAQPFRRSRD